MSAESNVHPTCMGQSVGRWQIPRRQSIVVLVIGMFVGALAIAGVEKYLISLRDWILSDPEALPQRVKAVVLILAVFLIAPLLAFGIASVVLGLPPWRLASLLNGHAR